MTIRTVLGLAAAAYMAIMAPASADLLDDIKAAGKVRIAVVPGVPLFAYVDENLNLTGSDVETARLIAEALGAEVEFVEIANAARVPTIQSRTADILVGNLAITPERQQVVVHRPLRDAGHRGGGAAAHRDLGLRRPRRPAHRRDPRHGERPLVSENAQGAEVVRFEDDATLITALATGQVDIVSTQSAVLAAINDRRANDPLDVKFVQRSLDLGIVVPQGEDGLREWLNAWLRENFSNGTLKELFKGFHDRDLPDDLVDRVH